MLTAPRIFINVGGRATVPDMPGVGRVPFLTNTSMLALDQLPEPSRRRRRQLCRPRVRADVPAVRRGGDGRGDRRRASSAARTRMSRPRSARSWSAKGIGVRTDAECIRFAPHDRRRRGRRRLHGGRAGGRSDRTCCWRSDAAEHRRPGPRQGRRRHRRARLHHGRRHAGAPTCPGIWALGDCNGRGAFTHTAYNDFEIVAANLLDGEHARSAATGSQPTPCTSIRRSAASA